MRCLHCGKELALLKRMRGGGQFCSEAHKQSYQEEYNRIALSRLLQAQVKPASAKANGAQDQPPVPQPPHTPVAMEESELIEEVQQTVEEVATEVVMDASSEITVEEAPAEPEAEAEEELGFEATETASFVPNSPVIAVMPEETTPYLEDWQAGEPGPVVPRWYFEGRAEPVLPGGEVLRLEIRPNLARNEYSAAEAHVTPNEFVPSNANPPELPGMRVSNKLQAAGPIILEVVPRSPEASAVAVLDEMCDFAVEAVTWDSELLDLFPSEIAFPAEDSEVRVISAAEGTVGVEEVEIDDGASSPSAAIEALTRLHHELVENQQASEKAEPAAVEPVTADAAAPEVAETPVAQVEAQSQPEQQAEVQTEPAGAQTEEEKARQPKAGQSVDFAVKMFAPLKPTPMEGVGVLLEARVLMPQLTGLPLRPKMAQVSPQTAQSLKAAQSKSAPEEATKPEKKEASPPAAVTTQAKPAAKITPAPVQATPPRPSQPAKPVTSAAWQKPQPAPVAKTAEQAGTVAPAKGSNGAKKTEASGKTKSAENEPVTLPTPPSASKAPAADVSKLSSEETEAPSFGMAAPDNSLWAAHKVKIIIAAAVLVIALVAYLVLGGKSGTPARNAPAADSPGPSIMVGAGGWVEGWASDLPGDHFGRQITMYRPSLKLSDYRIEFQGEIETKSLGWVFRAADPGNYYAMKLETVTPGLSPKIALFKYIIADGHQTQAGRVPIDIAARLDTMYKIRVDVRGSMFTTYVQGQLVDTWNDDQLKTGGVGFLNEREERGKVKSAQIFLLNGGKQ